MQPFDMKSFEMYFRDFLVVIYFKIVFFLILKLSMSNYGSASKDPEAEIFRCQIL